MNQPIQAGTDNASPAFANRVLAIDAFRGITILIMIFVNTLAGVRGVPAWMDHMPANVDGMTFVDIVFPAFLFIVGMSIPFALARREGQSLLRQQQHIFLRAAGLIILGVFMVNAEEGYNEAAMHMSIYLWSLLFYAGALLIWNVYRFKNTIVATALRTIGVVGLIVLGLQFRGGADGTLRLAPQWWGILGLIGWAYLYSCLIYQLARGKVFLLATAIGLFVAYYCLAHVGIAPDSLWFSQVNNAAHGSIVLCGMICSLIFFGSDRAESIAARYQKALIVVIALFALGFVLRPYFKISKIDATPTWCLYSAAICTLLFGMLYWIIDLWKWQSWTRFFKPAAANPLLTYLIPYIVFAAMQYTHLTLPEVLTQGWPGMLWSATYAVMVMVLVAGLNRLHVRMQL